METQFAALTPYENFLFALKAKESKRQYPHRLDKFLTFIGLQGTIEVKCTKLYELSKNNVELLQSYLIRFINSQKERIENREIAEGTLCNYVKAIKLFFSMNDIIINWKKLGKGIPQEKQSEILVALHSFLLQDANKEDVDPDELEKWEAEERTRIAVLSCISAEQFSSGAIVLPEIE